MRFAEAEQFVREDYPHALISACQRFLPGVLVLEPDAFVSAVNTLIREAPLAQSSAEATIEWLALKDAVLCGAECHHAWFHRRLVNVRCALFQPRPLNAPTTFSSLHVASVLRDFAIQYTLGFESAHCWPPAIRAAAVLRANPLRLWHVDDLATAVYASAATLSRSFRRIFGVTVLQYQTRLRLLGVVEQLRTNEGSIEGILVERGYRSPKDAYRLFRRLAGLTLADVRRLSDADFASLIERTVALPTAEWRSDAAESLRQMPGQRERGGRVKGATHAIGPSGAAHP